MYIPDCSDVTVKNMSYTQNPETQMYDTRDAAQNILRAVLEAHGDALKELPQQVAGGAGSLYDLASLDDTATDVRLAFAAHAYGKGRVVAPLQASSSLAFNSYTWLSSRTLLCASITAESVPQPPKYTAWCSA